jgi:hypothetical protein
VRVQRLRTIDEEANADVEDLPIAAHYVAIARQRVQHVRRALVELRRFVGLTPRLAVQRLVQQALYFVSKSMRTHLEGTLTVHRCASIANFKIEIKNL